MTGLLEELGRQFAARWAALLVVPGLLFVTTLGIAAETGGQAIRDVAPAARLARAFDEAPVPGSADRGLVLATVLLVAALLAAWTSGLAAQALAGGVERLWGGVWPGWAEPVARPLRRWRRRRWDAAHRRYLDARSRPGSPGGPDPPSGRPAGDELAAGRNRIALVPPSRPTWIGDRFHAADLRIWQQYGIDLSSCWSRLWLLIPDASRQAAEAARERYTRATLLGGWTVLYTVLGAFWYPALMIAAVVGAVAWRHGRTAAGVLADLAEAIVDVHGRDLAAALGVALDGDRITPPIGNEISERVRKSM